ncbi:anti-sigma factor domain-containing protein [Neobacillus drentensis]|uniref:anti-sigma factor domain-containing protein n=1 Tax=Neobacillus drentensis TaxID=220684 RepID=UPI002FFE7019
MKKGIIMEINEGFLTLLTPEGEFLQSRKQNQPYSLGEEIYFFPIESVNGFKTKRSIKNMFKLKTAWAVMVALIIFIGTFIPNHQNNKAYAYMSIDVNPSVELGVNKQMKVVELTGYNKEGKEIISHLKDWKKEDVSELTKAILSEMKKAGYLKEHHQVIISTVRIEQPEQKVEDKLQRKLDKIEASVNKEKVEVIVLTATQKELQKAHKQGVTAGKYQEEKLQTSRDHSKQDNVKTKEGTKDKSNVPAQSPTVNSMPPGQQKKQPENSVDESVKGNVSEKSNLGKNAISPGYLKRVEEEKLKQNQGQNKKQTNIQGKEQKETNQGEKGNYNSNNHGNSDSNKNKNK